MTYEPDDFLVGETFPEAVGGHDDEVAFLGGDFGGGDDGFGGYVGGCFEVRRGRFAEVAGFHAFAGFPAPFVDCVAEGAAWFQLA